MRLSHGIHLAYCTNIHRGGDWQETFQSLREHTLRVRDRVSPDEPYAIGLRLGDTASRQLGQADELDAFRAWLEENRCYIFTVNGFPYGDFHGTRVKEDVYAPDWTTPERVEYTKRLFDILAAIAPADSGGSVSTVPCSYKEFITSGEQVAAMRRNLWEVVDYIDELSERTGKDLHLGVEPEPLCYLETSAEMVEFYRQMKADRPGDERLTKRLGINYDTCHLAVEYEEAAEALGALVQEGIRISKLHFSSAMKVHPTRKCWLGWKRMRRIFISTKSSLELRTEACGVIVICRMRCAWLPKGKRRPIANGEFIFTCRFTVPRRNGSIRLPINCRKRFNFSAALRPFAPMSRWRHIRGRYCRMK